MPRKPKPYQLTIDDMDIGMEHIPGAVPADPKQAEMLRSEAFEALVTAAGGKCWPEEKIHVYVGNQERCVCLKESS